MKNFLRMAFALLVCTASARAGEIPPAMERFSAEDVAEIPDFQRHVVPLMGKLGCNGRACHGSFQGQGGFRLSLFGYDFKMDHEGLTKADEENEKEARVDLEFPEDSLMLLKPLLEMPHKGGKRMDVGSWQHRLLLTWIKGGAKPLAKDAPTFVRLDVTPREIVFQSKEEQQQLKAVALWSDGTREDVTCLCRFQSNDDAIATVEDGLVSAGEAGDTHVVVFYDAGVVPVPVMRPVSDQIGDKFPTVAQFNEVDRLVQQKLSKMGIVPSELADDAQFLRRVSLDITGSLPAPQEVSAFLTDSSSDKRARKIDELLERPTYAAWWTTRLCDITGNNDYELRTAIPQRDRPAQDWYDWIYKRVAENVPYDELVEGIVLATSREDGESYREYNEAMHELYGKGGKASYADRKSMPYYWARVNFRTNEERAIGFAYSFMGIRIQCAQCHKHPFDEWTQDDFNQFMSFFDRTRIRYAQNPKSRDEYKQMLEELEVGDLRGNQLRRELQKLEKQGKVVPYDELYVAPPRGNNRKRRGGGGRSQMARLLGGEEVDLNEVRDPREPIMDWLRNSETRLFAKAFVNRVWANYFNRGIVEPPDDLSLANPPTNAELLDYLTTGFIEHGYDMKWLHREIANSRTYQTSWVPNETNRLDERNFSHMIPRRLPAEVAYDALTQATACDAEIEKLQQDIAGRAIALAGSSPRYNNRGNAYALSVFGRSVRESNCDCDRSSEASLLQIVFLQNDDEVFEMIDRRDGGWLAELTGTSRDAKRQPDKQKASAADAKRIAAIQARIKKLRKAENADRDELKRLARRLAQLRADRADRAEKSPEPEQKLAESVSVDEAVRQAYLRSLSRYPTDEELNRAIQYVDNAESRPEGLRGLLWALLNTKEFIVNH